VTSVAAHVREPIAWDPTSTDAGVIQVEAHVVSHRLAAAPAEVTVDQLGQ